MTNKVLLLYTSMY